MPTSYPKIRDQGNDRCETLRTASTRPPSPPTREKLSARKTRAKRTIPRAGTAEKVYNGPIPAQGVRAYPLHLEQTSLVTMHHFAHLHVHSHYTMLGGTAGVAELAEKAAADGMTHLALADTNGLYGIVAFDKACRAVGVQPIIGMTISAAALPEEFTSDHQGTGRLVLLATGPEGYRSLCRLSSLIQGGPEREMMAMRGPSWGALKSHRKGLICLSGGRSGWVERYIRSGDLRGAQLYAAHLAGIYGENAYLSVELHSSHDQPVAREVIGLGQRLGLQTVAAQPVYCLFPEDAPRLRLLAAIGRNCPLEAVPASALPADGDPSVDLHWLSPDEVALRFAAFPQTVAATGDVTLRCEPALLDRRPIWPPANLPDGQTADEALAELAHAGFSGRYGDDPPPSARERLERELVTISRHEYAPFVLVVADIARFARQTDVPISTRGSVANSLVAYCTGITTVDPIAHDLLFERFLNPARTDPPDIDLDFCSRRRDEVLDYIRRTFGSDRVALVATISTIQPRSAIRETAKAYGLDALQTKRLMASLPHAWLSRRRRGNGFTLENVLAGLKDIRWRQIVRSASSLVGQPHHLSLHPGGVVITPGPLTEVVPVQWTPKGFLATQFNHQDLELIGLPKIDILGVRALTVLADAARLVQGHYDPDFRLADIPIPSESVASRSTGESRGVKEDCRGDPSICPASPDESQAMIGAVSAQPGEARPTKPKQDYLTANLLTRGETIGVFQCESIGARRTLRQLHARTLRDLAVANAFFKPGPAKGGMAQAFVRRYRGEEPVTYLHPTLAPILNATQGVLLFQEQLLQIAREIAGLSWEQADHLRRGVKFDPDEMSRVRDSFVAGCQRPEPAGAGFSPEQAETLWEQVIAFSGYGFNQGHATAYADVSYRSAYLKARWPAAFLCARLADRGGYHHPAVYIAEAVRLGFAVRPPHVNHSGKEFSLGQACPDAQTPSPTLWMGLGQVRDLRRASIEAIVTARERRPFSALRDLVRRVPLLPKEIAHLIQCGALDGLGESRAGMLAEADKAQQAGSATQMAFSFASPSIPPEPQSQRLEWERHLLGQPVSVHPIELVADRLPAHAPLRSLPESPLRRVFVAGVRLPGWTGGQGFFLGDGDTFIFASGSTAPPAWKPVLIRGRWMSDNWGTFGLKIIQMDSVPVPDDRS